MFIVTFEEKCCGRNGHTEFLPNFRKFETKDELEEFVEFLYETVDSVRKLEVWDAKRLSFDMEIDISINTIES